MLFWGQRGHGFELAGQLQATAKALLQPQLSLVTSNYTSCVEGKAWREWALLVQTVSCVPGLWDASAARKSRVLGLSTSWELSAHSQSFLAHHAQWDSASPHFPGERETKEEGGKGRETSSNFLRREKPYSLWKEYPCGAGH